jgi:hypothetical protein
MILYSFLFYIIYFKVKTAPVVSWPYLNPHCFASGMGCNNSIASLLELISSVMGSEAQMMEYS